MKVDFSRFSDEELMALEQNDFSKISDENLMYLDSINSEPSAEEPSVPSETSSKSKVTTSPLEAGIRGAAQAVSFGFADEVEARAMSLKDAWDKGSVVDLVSDYSKNIKDVREDYERNKINHPNASLVGTAVGALASTALPMGAVAKGATATAKIMQAAKTGAATGLLFGVGEAEDLSLKSLWETTKSTVLGAGFGVAGSAIAQGVGKVVSAKGLNIMGNKGLDKEASTKLLKGIGLTTSSSQRSFSDKLARKGMTVPRWAEEVSNMTKLDVDDMGNLVDSGEYLVNNIFDNPAKIYDKADDMINKIGDARDSILRQSNVKLPRTSVAKSLNAKLAGSVKASEIPLVQKILDDEIFKTTLSSNQSASGELVEMLQTTPLDAFELSQIRKNLDNSVLWNSISNSNKIKRELRNGLNELTDDVIKSSLSPEVAATAQSYRHKMSVLFSLQEATEKAAQEQLFGHSALIKDFTVNYAGKALGASAGMDPNATGNFLMGLRRLTTSGAYNRTAGMAPVRLANAIETVGSDAIRRLAIAADSDDLMTFVNESAAIEAEASLINAPLVRSISAVKSRKNEVIALLNKYEDEVVKEEFIRAVDSNDDAKVAAIISQLEKSSKAKKFIESGIGFDGIVYNEEDKLIIENELKKDLSIPGAQRQILLNELRRSGKIPNREAIQPSQRRVYEPKDSKKPMY